MGEQKPILGVAVVIENKLKSPETGMQLLDYQEFMDAHYPDYQRYYVFLTYRDQEPSCSAYLHLCYRDLLPLLRSLAGQSKQAPDLDLVVDTCLAHYHTLIHGRLLSVKGSQYEPPPRRRDMCEIGFRKHNAGFTAVLFDVARWRQDFKTQLDDLLNVLAKSHFPDLVWSRSSAGSCTWKPVWLRFYPATWKNRLHLRDSTGDPRLEKMMPHYTFECVPFGNDDPRRGSVIGRHHCEVALMLGLNNKGGNNDALRNAIVEKAEANPAVFNRVTRVKKKAGKDTTLLRFSLVSAHDIRTRSFQELTALINSRFETFLKAQHPLVEELLDSAAVKKAKRAG